jgi:hypothetical protein
MKQDDTASFLSKQICEISLHEEDIKDYQNVAQNDK